MKKLYSASGVRLAAFLGGPLALGFLMFKNFKTLGRERTAKNTMLISIAFSVILFGFLLWLPDEMADKIPNYLFPLVLSSFGTLLVKKYQQEEIEQEIAAGEAEHWSNWRAAGLALLWCGGTFISAFVLVFIIETFK